MNQKPDYLHINLIKIRYNICNNQNNDSNHIFTWYNL